MAHGVSRHSPGRGFHFEFASDCTPGEAHHAVPRVAAGGPVRDCVHNRQRRCPALRRTEWAGAGVYAHRAEPRALLLHPHNDSEQHGYAEWLVDPSYLNDSNVELDRL